MDSPLIEHTSALDPAKGGRVVSTDGYWNPILETLAPEKLQQLQLNKFRRIFTWAYDHSKFHRRLYGEAGIEPGDIRTVEDIRRVPKVEKSMMRAIQGKDPFPYGDMLCVPLEEVTEYHQTSGTTGQPVYQADSWQDWEWWAECWAYILWAQGYRPGDRVFIPFGYNVFVAFWAGHYGAEKIGCAFELALVQLYEKMLATVHHLSQVEGAFR